MGILSLGYRRPQHVAKVGEMRCETRASDVSGASQSSSVADNRDKGDKGGASVKSGKSGGSSRGIPPALSFDRIVDSGTCPPCTIRDFMNYLIYIERSAENLQFFLWFRDYSKRFSAASTSDLALAPEWTQAKADELAAKLQREQREKARREPETAATAIFKGTDFEKKREGGSVVVDLNANANATGGNWDQERPSSSPPHTAGDAASASTGTTNAASYRAQAQDAFEQAGAKQPFSIQPFREEIDRVIATYIAEDSPRQLNLSARERTALIQALAYTTHPSAFGAVVRTVESSLRGQAHPNFIRWSVCNGNPARVLFARCLGASLIVAASAAAAVLTLSRAGRGYRAVAAAGWVLGAATLVAAWKGMCVVLHGLHHRHVRPWELFETDERDLVESVSVGVSKSSLDSFGSSNSYEDEPWIVKYERRNVVRKVFDREVWIQEPALRQIQDTIFVQALLVALLVGGVLAAVFVVLPAGNFF